MRSRHWGNYDRPLILQYLFPQHDFGTGANITQLIPVPKAGGVGMSGKVLGIDILRVTENFAGSSSDGGVQVGDGSDADKYFDSGLVLDEEVDATEVVHLEDDGAAVDIESGRSSVTATMVATQGTPTGIADVQIYIAWW